MTDFQLLDDSAFEHLLTSKILDGVSLTVEYNYCTDCRTPMNKRIDTVYECPKCGLNRQLEGETRDCGEENEHSGTIRIGNKNNNRRSIYNICSDYSRTQKRAILDQLNISNDQFVGPKIPKDVLAKAAECYNKIQKFSPCEDGNNNNNNKKFVKRGNIKDEVLGALVYYECIRADVTRKKKDIAEFMKLPNNGISRGEDILRTLNAEGVIDNLPINEDPTESFVERYMEALGLDTHCDAIIFHDFIIELVAASIKKMIGISSISSSKVVGCIYILVQRRRLDITIQTIEDCCDNIRKSTFIRFAKEILDAKNITKFITVFEKYAVSHGYEGRIKKVPVIVTPLIE